MLMITHLMYVIFLILMEILTEQYMQGDQVFKICTLLEKLSIIFLNHCEYWIKIKRRHPKYYSVLREQSGMVSFHSWSAIHSITVSTSPCLLYPSWQTSTTVSPTLTPRLLLTLAYSNMGSMEHSRAVYGQI